MRPRRTYRPHCHNGKTLHVHYDETERREHFAALTDLDQKGIFNRMLDASPDLNDFSRILLTFVIDEKAADAYLRRIAAAKYVEETVGTEPKVSIGKTNTLHLH